MSRNAVFALVILAVGLQVATSLPLWRVEARGKNQLPPTNSAGVAVLEFTVDPVTGQFNGSLLSKNLAGVLEAHLHVGDKKTNGPVAFFVFPTDTLAPTGQPISGVWRAPFVSNSTLLNDEAKMNTPPIDFATFLKRLAKKEVYLNVHTVGFPEGEVRGQVEKYKS